MLTTLLKAKNQVDFIFNKFSLIIDEVPDYQPDVS